MKFESAKLAFGLGISTALLVSGCAEDINPLDKEPVTQTYRVGNSDWVAVKESIRQHYRNSSDILPAGDTCLIERGAQMVLRGGEVEYKNENALGTQCPDGAILDMTTSAARAQDVRYQAFATRRDDVTAQVSRMTSEGGKAVRVTGDWVEIVNPIPIKQFYSNGEIELAYGDRCYAAGKTQKIGRLATGESVMHVENADQMGTSCPTGTLFLVPGDR